MTVEEILGSTLTSLTAGDLTPVIMFGCMGWEVVKLILKFFYNALDKFADFLIKKFRKSK